MGVTTYHFNVIYYDKILIVQYVNCNGGCNLCYVKVFAIICALFLQLVITIEYRVTT